MSVCLVLRVLTRFECFVSNRLESYLELEARNIIAFEIHHERIKLLHSLHQFGF